MLAENQPVIGEPSTGFSPAQVVPACLRMTLGVLHAGPSSDGGLLVQSVHDTDHAVQVNLNDMPSSKVPASSKFPAAAVGSHASPSRACAHLLHCGR